MKRRMFFVIPLVAGLALVLLISYAAAQGMEGEVGPQDQPGAAPEALYFWDFEGNNGGFVGTLDWEWGTYSWAGGSGCSAGAAPVPAAHSGTDMWGTVLNDCYIGYGNNAGYDTCVNGNPADDSILSIDVDLSTVTTTAQLIWWEWFDLFLNWDWGEVTVNGNVVFQHCGGGYVAPSVWVSQTVDLTPYVGGVATIEFHMMASTVVNYAGWWIDDVTITGEAGAAPDIVVDAPPLEAAFCPDSSEVITFSICNDGTADLIWSLEEVTATAVLVESEAAAYAPAYDVPWLSEEPVSGTLPADACTDVDVTLDAGGMMPDDYTADLLLHSNDPDQPLVTLPVTMTVFEPAGITAVDVFSAGCEVTMTAYLVGEPPLSWQWDLDVFGVITDVNPISVDFGVSGSYPYTLTAWNDCGMDVWADAVDVVCEPTSYELYLPVILRE